ncbi:MAG: hypothetical protein LBN10_09310 [Propionibacteriaceae bacterium]|jgi:hypothetical protein|nr:hypothetical protein [Propionibacteriaceae bacterium]
MAQTVSIFKVADNYGLPVEEIGRVAADHDMLQGLSEDRVAAEDIPRLLDLYHKKTVVNVTAARAQDPTAQYIYDTRQQIEANKMQVIKLHQTGDHEAADNLLRETMAKESEIAYLVPSSDQSAVSLSGRGPAPGDAPSGGYAFLGFVIPLVGLILYLTWKDQTPLRAKSAGKGALIGVITSVALSILFVIVYVVVVASLLG